MISFFANLFGYVLNFLYELVKNYGLAIILFSIFVKALMLPITIKQQKTMKKSAKIQEEMKQIQFKYKNEPEKLNQEVMSLYKRENMSPFSGCLSSIVQIVLLFSVFYMVRSPLTYMKKIDSNAINEMKVIAQENGASRGYEEIAIINYVRGLENQSSVSEEEKQQVNENENNENKDVQDNQNEKQGEKAEEVDESSKEEANQSKFNINEYKDQININMDFLGVDLSKVPTQNVGDIKVFIIPVLYVISSFISIRITTKAQTKKKNDNQNGEQVEDAMAQSNKMMSWMMPIMSVSIASIAPLGLALYWLMNNVLMIIERLIIDKLVKDEENNSVIEIDN